MAAPRVPITDLPEQTTPVDTDLLVVQNGATTKKMTVGRLSTQTIDAVNLHLADATAAHAATAISANANTAPMTGTDVQAQLTQAAGRLAQLTNVNNTSDANKPISTATQTALDTKAAKTILISTTAPLAGGGDLSANRTLTVSDFTASNRGTVPPSGGSSDVYLRGDGTWGPVPPNGREPVSYRSATAAIVVGLGDENTMIIGARPTDMTCALPSNTTVPFAIGSEIDFMNMITTGTITFSADAGATVDGTPGLKLRAKFSVATAKKVSVNGWVVIGDLAS